MCLVFSATLRGFICRSAQAPGKPATPGAPELKVEYFGADAGYTIGMETVLLRCVVRNVGAGPLPEKTARLNCYALSGLDYTTGETRPVLPALPPNQAVTYRWRLEPTDASAPLVAAVLVESVGPTSVEATGESRAVLTVVPRFRTGPRNWDDSKTLSAIPSASAGEGSAWIGNDRVEVRVKAAQGDLPVLFLAGREGAGRRELATSVPLLQVRSGEEGQAPWWETFRWRDSSVRTDKTTATLTLTGIFGERWRGALILEAHRDTGLLTARLRLTARRVMRLAAIRMPTLLAESDTSSAASFRPDEIGLPTSAPMSPFSERDRVAAGHLGANTFGLSWPATLPLPGWHWNRLPVGDTGYKPVLGAEASSDEGGEIILPGATVEFPFRLFALAPSDTVRDALRFQMP